MDISSENKSLYELSFLLTEEAQLEDLKRIISQHCGIVTSEWPVKKIQLAYKIKKQTAAFFGCFHLEIEKEKVSFLEKDFKLSNSILRSLIIVNPHSLSVGKKQTGAPAAVAESGSVSPELKVQPPPNRESLPISNEDLEKKIEEILK